MFQLTDFSLDALGGSEQIALELGSVIEMECRMHRRLPLMHSTTVYVNSIYAN